MSISDKINKILNSPLVNEELLTEAKKSVIALELPDSTLQKKLDENLKEWQEEWDTRVEVGKEHPQNVINEMEPKIKDTIRTLIDKIDVTVNDAASGKSFWAGKEVTTT